MSYEDKLNKLLKNRLKDIPIDKYDGESVLIPEDTYDCIPKGKAIGPDQLFGCRGLYIFQGSKQFFAHFTPGISKKLVLFTLGQAQKKYGIDLKNAQFIGFLSGQNGGYLGSIVTIEKAVNEIINGPPPQSLFKKGLRYLFPKQFLATISFPWYKTEPKEIQFVVKDGKVYCPGKITTTETKGLENQIFNYLHEKAKQETNSNVQFCKKLNLYCRDE